MIDDKNIELIMINGDKQSIFPLNSSDSLLETKSLNNDSDNVIDFTYLRILKGESLILCNSFKKFNVKFLNDNFIKSHYPHFDYYTTDFKYRFIATIPTMCRIFYKNSPFDRNLHKFKEYCVMRTNQEV